MIDNPALGDPLKALGEADPTGLNFFATYIPLLVTLGFVIGSLIFFFVLITGAIQWIAGGRDKASLESARSRLVNGFVGLLILFSAFAIVRFLANFFGFDTSIIDNLFGIIPIGNSGGGGGPGNPAVYY